MRYLPFITGILASTAIVTPVLAQQAPTPPAAPDAAISPAPNAASTGGETEAGGIADIVVTAQRRSESLQKVPITITAVTADTLAKSAIRSSSDISVLTPGLQLVTSRTNVSPYLRGVGVQNSGVGEESPIATYVDGVYYASMVGSTFALNNVARLEVLKGPQGTLFGRNATGGLIQVITKDPSHTPAAQGEIGYGNYQTLFGTAYATAGLTDTIAADIAGFVNNQYKGFGNNVSGIAGINGQEINYSREWAVRSKIKLEADALEVTLSGDFDRRSTDLGVARNFLFGQQVTCRGQICNIPAVQAVIARTNGTPQYVIPYTVGFGGRVYSGGLFDSAMGMPRASRIDNYGGSAKIAYDLGDASITSTTAYRRLKSDVNFDQDGTPTAVADTTSADRTRTFQEEVLLVGSLDRLQYTGGLFYFSTRAGNFPLAITSIAPGNNFARTGILRTKSYAAFGQATYALTDTTNFTTGLRYTIDKRRSDGTDVARPGNARPAGTLLNSASQEKTFKKLTWRFALDQKITQNILAFASYSRGFKSGVYNVTNYSAPPVNPEVLDSLEAGLKTDLLDRTLRFNVSGFHYKYRNIQLFRVEAGITQILNAASAKIYGVDAEILVVPPVPVGDLTFSVNGSYLHGRYGTFANMPILVPNINRATGLPTGGSTAINTVTTNGQTMIRTPKYTGTFTADYAIPVGSGTLDFNTSYYFNSGFFWEPDNRIKQGSYSLLSAQVSYEFGRYKIGVFGRNLTDNVYLTQISANGALGDQFSAGSPRTYGVTFGVKLGG